MIRWICELFGLLSSLSYFNIRFGNGVELVIGCMSGLNDVDSKKVFKFTVPARNQTFLLAICFVQNF